MAENHFVMPSMQVSTELSEYILGHLYDEVHTVIFGGVAVVTGPR